jgi:hypothetical protein
MPLDTSSVTRRAPGMPGTTRRFSHDTGLGSTRPTGRGVLAGVAWFFGFCFWLFGFWLFWLFGFLAFGFWLFGYLPKWLLATRPTGRGGCLWQEWLLVLATGPTGRGVFGRSDLAFMIFGFWLFGFLAFGFLAFLAFGFWHLAFLVFLFFGFFGFLGFLAFWQLAFGFWVLLAFWTIIRALLERSFIF